MWDYDNKTPLHFACINEHFRVVRFLIEKGNVKNVNPADRWGNTPLDYAR